MKAQKNIALVAHDNRKKDLVEWVEWNVNILLNHSSKIIRSIFREIFGAHPILNETYLNFLTKP
jgi:hypothetical protein